jgi:hypothetical protein
MRITAATALYANQSISSSSSAPSADTQTAQPGATTGDSGGIKRADFSSMTRKELLDWVNGQIKSGQMTLDESTTFVSMTVSIPVDAVQGQSMGIDDREKVDFLAKAQQGIGGAIANHDDQLLARLQSAIRTMQQHQGDAVGVDMQA